MTKKCSLPAQKCCWSCWSLVLRLPDKMFPVPILNSAAGHAGHWVRDSLTKFSLFFILYRVLLVMLVFYFQTPMTNNVLYQYKNVAGHAGHRFWDSLRKYSLFPSFKALLVMLVFYFQTPMTKKCSLSEKNAAGHAGHWFWDSLTKILCCCMHLQLSMHNCMHRHAYT